jgi:hypothetical protein
VTILLGDGAGDFSPAASSPEPAGTTPTWVTSATIDADADQDLAVSSFNSDAVTILLNNETFDRDSDGVIDDDDKCPEVASNKASGCPSFRRNLSIDYANAQEAFKGRLNSSEPACEEDGESVSVFRKRRGPDKLIGKDQTDDDGEYQESDPGRDGRYYAKTGKDLNPAVGICKGKSSRTLQLG